MPIFAIHEHELKTDANINQYQQEISHVLKQMKIPGLLAAYHLKGFKGERQNHYAVLWIFKNKDIIEKNFGTLENPKYPKDWLYYENEILAKYLNCLPDKIKFTDYDVLTQSNYDPVKAQPE